MENNQFVLIQKLIRRELSKFEQEQFQNFEHLFKIYNSHTNLISKNDEKKFFEKHIYDSLAMTLFFNKYKISEEASMLDVGTGGGFPSLPLAIIYPHMKIYPLDSIAKKIGFIEFIQKELRLDNLCPLCKRVEELPLDFKESFDVVTSRAVAPMNTLLEYTVPFAKTESYIVAFKSKIAEQEILQAQNALKILHCEVEDRIKYDLPIDESYNRELLVIKKTKKTANNYPRKSGQAKKCPL